MRNIVKIVVLIVFGLTLIGCSSKQKNSQVVNSQFSQDKQNIAAIFNELSGPGVRVLTRSNNSVALILSNREFFVGNSANFTEHALDNLELIFALSKYQRGNTIAIVGYTPRGKTSSIDNALAKDRAERIMHYLYRAGVNANFVYADSEVWSTKERHQDYLNDQITVEFKDFY